MHANSVLTHHVSKQDRRKVLPLLAVFAYLHICIALIYYVFKEEKLLSW